MFIFKGFSTKFQITSSLFYAFNLYLIFSFSLSFYISLHKHLIEHLNAEIVLHTITDVNIALEWVRSTFLYIRALKNPAYYGRWHLKFVN